MASLPISITPSSLPTLTPAKKESSTPAMLRNELRKSDIGFEIGRNLISSVSPYVDVGRWADGKVVAHGDILRMIVDGSSRAKMTEVGRFETFRVSFVGCEGYADMVVLE
jgi:hypothetical protein